MTTKSYPNISDVMTVSPHTIGREQPLSKAREMMHDYKIRHLPVLEGGKLIGILSDRDVNLIVALDGVDENKVVVEEAMSQIPYAVEPSTSLDIVVSEMAEHKYGSAVIIEHSKVLGIFTTVDALRVFSEYLKQ
jgi:acetoin utilization protein AcuB